MDAFIGDNAVRSVNVAMFQAIPVPMLAPREVLDAWVEGVIDDLKHRPFQDKDNAIEVPQAPSLRHAWHPADCPEPLVAQGFLVQTEGFHFTLDKWSSEIASEIMDRFAKAHPTEGIVFLTRFGIRSTATGSPTRNAGKMAWALPGMPVEALNRTSTHRLDLSLLPAPFGTGWSRLFESTEAFETLFGVFRANRNPEAWRQLLAPGRERSLEAAWKVPETAPAASPKPRF